MPIGTPEIPNFNLKVIFLVHFIFMSVSFMGFWHTDSYLFYNCIFILLLIWSIFHGQSQEPLQLAIVCNGTAILLDILLLIMCFPDSDRARERFSAAMAIFNLIIRPFSTYIMMRNLEERGGNRGNITSMFSGTRTESYEDIDRTAAGASNHPKGPVHSSGGYNFETAQQI